MIASLQLLRFVAAALIVLHHAMREFLGSFAFGEFGVDIFFVISGFIISHITQDGREQFFTRRLIRIVPLYWLLTCAIAVIAYVTPQLLHNVKWDVSHVIASLMFIPWWTESLKFEPMLPMGWTLNYELWFYLLFYVAMRINGSSREGICSLFIVCGYAVTNMLPLGSTATLSFYADSIVLEFIFGMTLSVLYRTRKALLDRVPPGVVLCCAVASLGMFYYTTWINHFDLPRCIYWGVPASLCVIACLGAEVPFRQYPRWMISAALVGGEISYPMYLMHMFLIAALSRLGVVSTLNVVVGFLLALLLSSVAAYVASYYVDKPIRRVLSAAFLNRSSPA
jgi:exopolysaccharide production protein ExoZ